MNDDTELRHTFDREAQLYNEARPRYPSELFEALIKVTNLPSEARLVEIGPGTGQATVPLAEKGYDITAIELGAGMAKVAQNELRKYPNVRVITGAFEDVDLPANTFDLVFAATAFHWVKPELRYAKPYKILKDDGHLAIIHTNHISHERGDSFFTASQPIYKRYFGSSDDVSELPTQSDIKATELDVKLFELIHFECFPLIITYTAKEYARLLNTSSPNLALPTDKRKGFLRDIETLISEQFNGRIEKPFVMSLTVARKLPGA